MPAVAVAPAHRRTGATIFQTGYGESWNPFSPGGKGKTGRLAQDNRRFINAVFWILRTGAPWRDLPPDYGDWKNNPPPLLPLAGPERLGRAAGGGDG